MIVTAGLPSRRGQRIGQRRRARRGVAHRQGSRTPARSSVTSLFGGVPPSVRKPALASSASCSGLRMNRANSLAALTCSCDSQSPLSSTVGEVGHGRRARRQPRRELCSWRPAATAARWNSCCSVVTTACTGAVAGSAALEQRVQRGGGLGVGELGLPGHQRVAPRRSGAGRLAPGCGRRSHRLGRQVGRRRCRRSAAAPGAASPSPAGSARPARRDWSAAPAAFAQFCWARASLSCGRIGKQDGRGDQRAAVADGLRACGGLEPGLRDRACRDPQRGSLAQFSGPLADEAVDHLVGARRA